MNIVLAAVERYAAFSGDFLLCYDDVAKKTTLCYQKAGKIAGIEKSWDVSPEELRVDKPIKNQELRAWLCNHFEEKREIPWQYDYCRGDYDPIVLKGYKAVPLFKMSGVRYVILPVADYVALVKRWVKHCSHCK